MLAVAARAKRRPRRQAAQGAGLGYVAGFAHSSRPLAAKTIEEMGKKTGAWTTDISYDAGQDQRREPQTVRRPRPQQHDRHVPRRPADQAATDARRKALLEFVRGGRGLVGIHAATDSITAAAAAAAPAAAVPVLRALAGAAPAAGAGAPPAPAASAAAGAAAPAARARRSRRRPRQWRRRTAVARVQQDDRRLLQVPLELADADHGQDRRSEESDQRARSRASRSTSSTRSTPSTRTRGRATTSTS